ncbi:MAG: putative peptidyl-prolyl cis-trans isomerase [Chlamydiia bacterium]|nr:putative peptidyl-prolyl cis-trans isomerase [Chlamydiia bacterium]
MIKNILLCLSFCLALSSNVFSKTGPIVVMETTQGAIEIELMPDVAPKACENFITLANQHYYDGIRFHRVIKGFMIQGGDPLGNGTGGKSAFGRDFEDEVSSSVLFNQKGLLAMANRGPNTNGSQFFITTADAGWLNGKHTIFGKVVSGYDIVQKIERVRTGYMDRPVEDQKMIRVYMK